MTGNRSLLFVSLAIVAGIGLWGVLLGVLGAAMVWIYIRRSRTPVLGMDARSPSAIPAGPLCAAERPRPTGQLLGAPNSV